MALEKHVVLRLRSGSWKNQETIPFVDTTCENHGINEGQTLERNRCKEVESQESPKRRPTMLDSNPK